MRYCINRKKKLYTIQIKTFCYLRPKHFQCRVINVFNLVPGSVPGCRYLLHLSLFHFIFPSFFGGELLISVDIFLFSTPGLSQPWGICCNTSEFGIPWEETTALNLHLICTCEAWLPFLVGCTATVFLPGFSFILSHGASLFRKPSLISNLIYLPSDFNSDLQNPPIKSTLILSESQIHPALLCCASVGKSCSRN